MNTMFQLIFRELYVYVICLWWARELVNFDYWMHQLKVVHLLFHHCHRFTHFNFCTNSYFRSATLIVFCVSMRLMFIDYLFLLIVNSLLYHLLIGSDGWYEFFLYLELPDFMMKYQMYHLLVYH